MNTNIAIIILLTATATAAVVVAVVYKHALSSLEKEHFVVQARIAQSLLKRPALMYATVLEIDLAGKNLLIAVKNQFIADGPDQKFLVRITEDTEFVRQELVWSDDAYTGFSESLSGTLEDLQPGTRVAIVLNREPETQHFIAQVILFGEPVI